MLEDGDNEINVNKSDMVSIPDQEDMVLRIKHLTGRVSEESSDKSGGKTN